MEVPTYHSSGTCGSQESCWSVLWYEMILFTGGSNGVLFKLNYPNIYACAGSCGFTRKAHKKLSVQLDWSRSIYHSYIGESVSQDKRPACYYFLKVWIACSETSSLWICDGTIWYLISLYSISDFNSVDASLSMTKVLSCIPE